MKDKKGDLMSFTIRIYVIFAFLMIFSVSHADSAADRVADRSLLKEGVKYYRQGQYVNAAIIFHQLTNFDKISVDNKARSNYYLGLSLFNLKLYQASSYPIINAIRSDSKKFKQKSLEKLIAISNKLGDQQMLDLAMTKMLVSDLEKLAVDVYYYKLAFVSYEKNKLDQAIKHLKSSIEKNPKSEAALNLLALSYLKKNETDNAIETYTKLLSLYESKSSQDSKKGHILLNIARSYFQGKKFNEAAKVYRSIPKDNDAYRESLTELAWTYLNLGKLRSALATLQTLHTPFYENYSEPESLVLRAILHNYNCQFDDAELVVNTFNNNFVNVLDILHNWTSQKNNITDVLAEISYATEALKNISADKKYGSELAKNYNGKIPFKVVRSILKNNSVENAADTYTMVKNESRLAKKYFSTSQSSLRPFLEKIYEGRVGFYKNQLANNFNQVVLNIEKNMAYYKQQILFVNYEILEAKKSQMRTKALAEEKLSEGSDAETKDSDESAAKEMLSEAPSDQPAVEILVKPEPPIKENYSRSHYVKSGYRYWPYQGEAWIDEVDTYQYSGENLCVQK